MTQEPVQLSLEQKRYITTDAAIAAYLQSIGYLLLEIDFTKPNRCIFHFENSNGLVEAVRKFEVGNDVSHFYFCYKRILFRVKNCV